MSQREGSDEKLSRGEPLDDFEAALAALRPRIDAGAGRTEFIPFDIDGNSPSTSCRDSAGHEFVCIHCGINPPVISPARRWAWPGVAAAMTSLAATLLIVLVSNQPAQVAHRQQLPTTKNVPATRTNLNDPPNGLDASAAENMAIRRFARPTDESRRILSTADLGLCDDLVANETDSNRRATASYAEIESVEASLTNAALKRQLLGQ